MTVMLEPAADTPPRDRRYQFCRVRRDDLAPLAEALPLIPYSVILRLALAALREKLVAEGRLPA